MRQRAIAESPLREVGVQGRAWLPKSSAVQQSMENVHANFVRKRQAPAPAAPAPAPAPARPKPPVLLEPNRDQRRPTVIIQANAQHIRNDAMGTTQTTNNRSHCSTPRRSTRSPLPDAGPSKRLNLEETYRGGDEPGTHPLDLTYDLWLQSGQKVIEIHNVEQANEPAPQHHDKNETRQDSSPSKGDQVSPGVSDCTGNFPACSPARAVNDSPESDVALQRPNSGYDRENSSPSGGPAVIKQAGKKLF